MCGEIRIRRVLAAPPSGQVTGLLRAWSDGDEGALDRLLPLVEAQLRRRARAYMARERRGQTQTSATLVNEDFVRLVDPLALDGKTARIASLEGTSGEQQP